MRNVAVVEKSPPTRRVEKSRTGTASNTGKSGYVKLIACPNLSGLFCYKIRIPNPVILVINALASKKVPFPSTESFSVLMGICSQLG